MMSESILLHHEHSVATITLNRPHTLNALDLELARSFAEITDDLRHDAKLKAVVLQGAGKAFMAGGDIDFFQQNITQMPKGTLPIIRYVNAAIMNLSLISAPVLACVQGAVAGVGISFMLAADLVLAAANTQFTLAYSKLGISPDGGASYHLPRLVGKQKAMELLLFSDRFDAATAKQLGLVNWVIEEKDFDDYKMNLITHLCHGPKEAFANIKQLVQQSINNNLAQQLEYEAQAFAKATAGDEFKTAVAAFVTKKTANSTQ